MKCLSFRTYQWMARLSIAMLALMTLVSCNQGQIGELIHTSFSTTPRCGQTDQLLHFMNSSGETIEIEGIGISPGTNPDGNFKLMGITVGASQEIEPLSSGGIGKVIVPAGLSYTLRVRYQPLKNTVTEPHMAIIDMAYLAPTPGIIQVEVSGTSTGVADCPEQIAGEQVGLDGDVILTIDRLVAASPQLAEPLDSSLGIASQPFIPVVLDVTMDVGNGTDGTIDFPAITDADDFVLPPPDPSISPTLATLVDGDTIITTREAVTGTYDASVGFIEINNLKVDLVVLDPPSEIDLTIGALTTDAVAFVDFFAPLVALNAGFDVVGDNIVGQPINKETGSVILVGIATVDRSVGKLSSAQGSMAVMIEATILCSNGTTDCAAP